MKTTKYEDLADQVIDYTGVMSEDIHVGIHEALAYLDNFPDQVPEWTITESRAKELGYFHQIGNISHVDYAEHMGATVVPDPDPDPEEVHKLAQALYDAAFDKPWESFDDLARQALKRGVKAPGVGDE